MKIDLNLNIAGLRFSLQLSTGNSTGGKGIAAETGIEQITQLERGVRDSVRRNFSKLPRGAVRRA